MSESAAAGSPSLASRHISVNDLPSVPQADTVRGGRQQVSVDAAPTRYEAISLAEIEMQRRMQAANEPETDDEQSEEGLEHSNGIYDEEEEVPSDEDENEEFGPIDSDSEKEDDCHTPVQSQSQAVHRRQKSLRPSTAKRARLDAAECVFGAEPSNTASGDANSEDGESDVYSMRSNTQAEQDIFPTSGVTCVGCNLCNTITRVDKFIEDNLMRMEERNLFRSAAGVYKRIAASTMREGNPAPEWPWRDLMNHYKFHVVNHRLSRKTTINHLEALKMRYEESMVRVTETDGNEESEVDGQKVDRYLKIVLQQSKERLLLAAPPR